MHTEAVNGRDKLLVTYSINYAACIEDQEGIKESDGNFDPTIIVSKAYEYHMQ